MGNALLFAPDKSYICHVLELTREEYLANGPTQYMRWALVSPSQSISTAQVTSS